MEYKELLTSKWISVLPIVMLLIFVAFYITSQKMVVECTATSFVTCSRLDTGLLPVQPNRPEIINSRESAINYLSRLEKQYSGRMFWMFLAAANLLLCLCVLSVLWLVAARWVGPSWSAALVLISIFLGGLISYIDELVLAGPLFKQSIQLAGWAGIENFDTVNRWINALPLACAVALALVTAAVIYGEGKKSDALKALAAKRDDLKILLYAGSVSLVIGVLRMDQGFTWATGFGIDPGIAAIPKAFFASVTATLGGFYTLLLAFVYIPAAFIIYERAKNLIGDNPVPDEWSKTGFTFSFSETLPRILIIAAPLLTGPISELLKRIPSSVG